MTSNQSKAAFYREQNFEAARIIAADPARCLGIQEWARLVLNSPAKQAAPAYRRAA
jgi:hypothetical protein